MIKIEAVTLEAAYKDAASKLECSVTELNIEVIQVPSKGLFGLFKKPAVIVAVRETSSQTLSSGLKEEKKLSTHEKTNSKTNDRSEENELHKTSDNRLKQEDKLLNDTASKTLEKVQASKNVDLKENLDRHELNDTIMPNSFVSIQDEDDARDVEVDNYLADYEDEESAHDMTQIANSVEIEINELFDLTCFEIDAIEVSPYDENTLLVEFKGKDAALLIGKEGYRYKALSYMLFNWINTKYQVQLRLEIAEFLKNQEESISKYLVGVCENIDRDGRAQTKILDGVLIQIALNELRERYPDKYIVIRSTRDGLKYIIINDYHSN